MPKQLLINQTSELISLLKERDRRGFDRLYQVYSKAIFGIISSSCADVKVAEEILQVSFSTIWKKISDFEPDKQHLFGWMLTITREVMQEMIRENNLEGSEIQKLKNNVTDVNNVLFLLVFKGYSIKNVSKILSISEEAVKIKLKQELDPLKGLKTNEK